MLFPVVLSACVPPDQQRIVTWPLWGGWATLTDGLTLAALWRLSLNPLGLHSVSHIPSSTPNRVILNILNSEHLS